MSWIYSIGFFLQAVFTPGTHRVDGVHVPAARHVQKNRIAVIDTVVNECSALCIVRDSTDYFLTVNDSGGKPEVFSISSEGKLIQTFAIPNAVNKDWEEVEQYTDSLHRMHIVIGDMGNNRNKRRDLCLYDYMPATNTTVKHSFYYEDQTAFPPSEDSLNYDCEAFFIRGSSYYFLSKNRSKGEVKLYRLPMDTAAHKAVVIQRIQMKGMITSCSLIKVNEHEVLAVLLYGRFFVFNVLEENNGVRLTPVFVKSFARSGQAEGIALLNTNSLLITNEKGKLFRISYKGSGHKNGHHR